MLRYKYLYSLIIHNAFRCDGKNAHGRQINRRFFDDNLQVHDASAYSNMGVVPQRSHYEIIDVGLSDLRQCFVQDKFDCRQS